MPRIYEYKDLLGCVSQHKSQRTGTLVSIYNAEQAYMDPGDGAWVTFCEEHGSLCNWPTLAKARYHAPSVDWCEECMANLLKTRDKNS